MKLDGEPLAADPLDVPADALDGRVLQLGKRRFRRLRIGLRRRVLQSRAAAETARGSGLGQPGAMR